MEQLPDHYWEVVLLHGLIGLTVRETADALGAWPTTVQRRYVAALAEITHYINLGGSSG